MCNNVVQPIALTKSFAPSLDSAYFFENTLPCYPPILLVAPSNFHAIDS